MHFLMKKRDDRHFLPISTWIYKHIEETNSPKACKCTVQCTKCYNTDVWSMKNITFFITVRYAESISWLLSSITNCGALSANNWNSKHQSTALGYIFLLRGCISKSDFRCCWRNWILCEWCMNYETQCRLLIVGLFAAKLFT